MDPLKKNFDSNIGDNVLLYNPARKTLKNLTLLPEPRIHHAAVKCNKKIYIFGGTKPKTSTSKAVVSKKMWSLEPLTLEWKLEPNLPEPRRDFGMASTESGFFVIGGEDQNYIVQSTLYFFNAKHSKWTELAPMNVPKAGLAACLLGSKIWTAGGLVQRTGRFFTNSIESYELKSNKWTTEISLRIPCCYSKMCTVQNTLYIVGGTYQLSEKVMKSLNVIYKYDENVKEWIDVAKLNDERNGHAIVGFNDGICIIGGVSLDKNRTLSSIEYFSTENERCKFLCPLPIPSSGLAALLF